MNVKIGTVTFPNKPLTNVELESAAKKLRVPNFRGVFSRDALPKRPWKREAGILNLDDFMGEGTHWVGWYKNGKQKNYFDSFGLHPPSELVSYLGPGIRYNTERVQRPQDVICGHLTLHVIKRLSSGKDAQDVINNLING